MNLTIFGATGGIGSALLKQAVDAGHTVTVLVRTPSQLTTQPARVVTGDAADPSSVAHALGAGTDAVLSALGPRQSNDPVMAVAARNMVAAMQAAGVQRFVGISASGLHIDASEFFLLRFAKRAVIQRVFAEQYANLALMEETVTDSSLTWTLVCPPYLKDDPATGTYRMAIGHNLNFGFSMRRADVAKCMLDVVNQPATIRQRVFPAN